jgi:hypothetical protein
MGDVVAQLVEALLEAGRLWVKFLMVSWEFVIDIICLAALWLWG